jgi:nucleoside diphosphate kinase
MDQPCNLQLHCQLDQQLSAFQKTFCLLKSEAYLAKKDSYIEQRIKNSGLVITERWKVRLTFGDILRMYDSAIPRITSIMRFPPLFKLDMYILEGNDAINRMYRLKHRIRYEIWGREFKKGGFLHAPDSLEEARRHQSIIANRMIESK